MLLLTIETCTETSTLGLVRDGSVLGELAFPSRHTLARRLLSRLDWLLVESGLTKHDLQGIAVSRGPGSFTGVRIGLAAAKTLALGLHIPLVGISTLEALAYPFRGLQSLLLAPVINARRQQAYLALFRGAEDGLQRLSPDMLLSAPDFGEELAQQAMDVTGVVLIGQVDGLPAAFPEAAPPSCAAIHSLVTPRALAALAEAQLVHGDVDDPVTLAPIYLRGAAN